MYIRGDYDNAYGKGGSGVLLYLIVKDLFKSNLKSLAKILRMANVDYSVFFSCATITIEQMTPLKIVL